MKTRTKRKICVAIFEICFFMIYGLIGGLEKEYITIKEFTTQFIIYFVIGGFAIYKSGYLK